MNPSESPYNAIERSEKPLGIKESLRSFTLSAAMLASMAQIASAEGASQAEAVSCLEDSVAQNIQMVTERFPELNQKIAAFAEATEQLMNSEEYDAAEISRSNLREARDTRYQNFAWVSQMVNYCGAELVKLESEVDLAVLNGLDTSELESKKQSLEAVIENLDEVRVGFRDM